MKALRMPKDIISIDILLFNALIYTIFEFGINYNSFNISNF